MSDSYDELDVMPKIEEVDVSEDESVSDSYSYLGGIYWMFRWWLGDDLETVVDDSGAVGSSPMIEPMKRVCELSEGMKLSLCLLNEIEKRLKRKAKFDKLKVCKWE